MQSVCSESAAWHALSEAPVHYVCIVSIALQDHTGCPEVLLVNESLLLEALKKAPSVWPRLESYNMMVYNDPGDPQDRGAHLDKPFAEDNTGFIGSGTQLTTGEAFDDAQVIPSVLSWPVKVRTCYERNARIADQGAAETGIAICPQEGILEMAVGMQAAAKRHIGDFPANGWDDAECERASFTQ